MIEPRDWYILVPLLSKNYKISPKKLMQKRVTKSLGFERRKKEKL